MNLTEKKRYYATHFDYLSPLLNIDTAKLHPSMVPVVCQGIILPACEDLQSRAMENVQTLTLLFDNYEWIKKVINDAFVIDSLYDYMIAQPDAVGEDAFIGAWERRGQVFQLIITRNRIHFVTNRPADAKDTPADLKDYAFYCVERYLNVDHPITREGWKFRTIGNSLLGYRDFDFFRLWEHTIIFLTDGKGIKLSVMKREGETSPPQRIEGKKDIPVWFIRDKKQ